MQESWVGTKHFAAGSKAMSLAGSMKFADATAFERYNAYPVHQKLLGWLIWLITGAEVSRHFSP